MADSLFILFYLPEGRIGRTGLAKIYCRLVYRRRKAEFYTGLEVEAGKWNSDTQRPTRQPRIKEELSYIENRLQEVRRELNYEGQLVSAKLVKDRFLNRGGSTGHLLAYYEVQLKRMREQPGQLKPNTVGAYGTAFRQIKAFVNSQQIEDVPLSQVDFGFLQKIDAYWMCKPPDRNMSRRLAKKSPFKTPIPNTSKKAKGGSSAVGLARNTAASYHRHLKAVLNMARKEGLIKQIPYENFPIRHMPSTRMFLTLDEIRKLEQLTLTPCTSAYTARGLFLFSVYTGLRYSDVIQLKGEDIKKDAQGRTWLFIAQQKTDESLRVPLLVPALSILTAFDGVERKITGSLFPKLRNYLVNRHLKRLAHQAGLQKPLTFHIARHTYATTITLANDVPLEVVSKLLGHKSVRTTQIYAKISNTHLARVTDVLEKKLALQEVKLNAS